MIKEFFNRRRETLPVPKHVGIILDGNRTYARRKKLARVTMGHEAGTRNLEPIIEHAKNKGVEAVTLYVFSTENWNRDPEEVSGIMDVLDKTLKGPSIQRLIDNGVKLNAIGDLSKFDEKLQKGIEQVVFDSKDNNGITLNLALGYGGRDEIVRATRKVVEDKLQPEEITEETFSDRLDTAGQPDVDLLIRSGGQQRTSGFLPYQATYAELYFTKVLWPAFRPKHLEKAIVEFGKRKRKFGK